MKGILILMRMRRKKHGAERIAACSAILIEQNAAETVDPSVFFPVSRPLHLEIGCGKGDFAVGMAAKHPDCNLIAMERVPDVACIALEKAMAKKDTRPDNLRFLIGDAQTLTDRFLPHTVDRIYLNFSDPWPKKGVQLTSVDQSCPTLCDPMNHSTPGLPVRHQLPESTQTHVH